MIIAALILQATVSALAPLGRQTLPAKGCAAYLWSASGERALVAMAGAEPASLRLAIGGKRVDYPRIAQDGGGALGFGERQTYRGGDVTATLEMSVVVRGDLQRGAQVPSGVLTVERSGQDTVVLPVAGLVGCA